MTETRGPAWGLPFPRAERNRTRATRQRRGDPTPLCRAAVLSACARADSPSGVASSKAPAQTTSTAASLVAPRDGETGLADSDGHQIHCEVRGLGDPAEAVHGWSGHTESDRKTIGWVDALVEVRQVVAVDIRGRGDSDEPHHRSACSHEPMGGDVIAVMDELGIERADLVGYSLGAFSGVHLVGHESDRFSSAVLMGIGDETPATIASAPVIADALRAGDPSEITDPGGQFYRALVSVDPRNDPEALAAAALQMWPEGFPSELGGPGLTNVSIPVLIMNGANDLPYADTDQDLVALIGGAALVEIPDADHYSVLADPRFKDEAVAFLGANSAGSG